MPSMRPPSFGSPRRRRRSGGRGGSGRGGDGRFAPCGRSTDRRPARLCVPVGDERGPQATPVVASSGASRGSCSLRSSGSRTRSIVPEVVAALRRLSPQQRAVIHLTYWEDLTPTTVAARLGIREGNRSPAARAWSSTPGGGARWALSRTSVNSVRRRVNGSRSRWGWSVTRRRRRAASTGCSRRIGAHQRTPDRSVSSACRSWCRRGGRRPGCWECTVRASGRPIESENPTGLTGEHRASLSPCERRSTGGVLDPTVDRTGAIRRGRRRCGRCREGRGADEGAVDRDRARRGLVGRRAAPVLLARRLRPRARMGRVQHLLQRGPGGAGRSKTACSSNPTRWDTHRNRAPATSR